MSRCRLLLLATLIALATAQTATAPRGTQPLSPRQAFGAAIGDDYFLATYTELESYWRRLDRDSDRMSLVDIGRTEEGRAQVMAVVTSPENQAQLERYRGIARRLALAEDLTDEDARALAAQGKTIVCIAGGLHASEVLSAQQLIQIVYELVSGNDPETERILRDVIVLVLHANPDGHELVARSYMSEPDPGRRSLTPLPRPYQKYVGHDNNRDFYMATQAETVNINRVLFRDWLPQIVYDHHQAPLQDAVMFAPPFAGPINPRIHPAVADGIDAIGAAIHQRLKEEGKRGAIAGDAANYSMWWNGGLRTTPYFHNQLGILTEAAGSPSPGAGPSFRLAVDYSVSANRAVLDAAARGRERWLYGAYRMGRDAIDAGSRASGADARAYILPSDQPDFPTAGKFVDALIKAGVAVHRATSGFVAAGKSYGAGSYVIRTAQAFRPHVLDMFEPQWYPADGTEGTAFAPYDLAGWTLALQMGVDVDRVFDDIDGKFTELTELTEPSEPIERQNDARIALVDRPGGWSTSGWIRWLLERYEFPYDLVFTGEWESTVFDGYDIVILPGEAVVGVASELPARTSLPALVALAQRGGTLLAMGQASSIGRLLRLPISYPLASLPASVFNVPGSVLQATVDSAHPLASGLGPDVNVMFNNNPVFSLRPSAESRGVRPIAWFDSPTPLRSGVAVGQDRLDGMVAGLEAPIGRGRVVLFGPDITFRAQSHGTFKFLFNTIHDSKARRLH